MQRRFNSVRYQHEQIPRFRGILRSMATLGLTCASAHGQVLKVLPDVGVGFDPTVFSDFVLIEADQWPANEFRARAFLISEEGGSLDVSGLVDWSLQGSGASSLCGPGRVCYSGPGVSILTAQLLGMHDAAQLWVLGGSASGDEREHDLMVFGADPIESHSIATGVNVMLDRASVAGVPVDALRQAAGAVTFRDNVFTNFLGMQSAWLPDHVNGEFLRDGTWYASEATGKTAIVTVPTIIVQTVVAEKAAAQQLVTANGELTAEARVILNELSHAITYLNIADEEIDAETDEDISNIFESLFRNIFVASQIASSPNPTHADKYALRGLLNTIRVQLNQFRTAHPREYELFMRTLGWGDDEDNGGGGNPDGGNWIPDYLDDILENHGLNYDTLPTSPEPQAGGGCDGGLIVIPGDDSKPSQAGAPPSQIAIVGCDTVHILQRDSNGHFVLVSTTHGP